MADDLDPDVKRFLRERATADDRVGSVAADEVLVRALPRSVERRRPVLLATAAAAVLIAALLGFAAGRSTSPAPPATVAAGNQPDEPAPPQAGYAVSGGGFAGKGFAVDGSAAPDIPPLEQLFVRTTADGVTIRAYLEDHSALMQDKMAGYQCEGSDWCPPPECHPGVSLVPELSNAAAASQLWIAGFPVAETGANAEVLDFGQREGAPVSARGVHVADDVTLIRAEWPDAAVDEMAPVKGWAIVAHAGADAPTITITRGDGSTAVVETSPGYFPAECQPPPPPLPPDGAGPGDPAAVGGGYVVNNGPTTAVAPN